MSAIDGHAIAIAAAAADAILPSATKTEKFLLTAADQKSGSRDERLNRVISSKYEAGLLKPYNYVKGYARLSRWMDRKYMLSSFFFFRAMIFLIIRDIACHRSLSNRFYNLCRSFDRNLDQEFFLCIL